MLPTDATTFWHGAQDIIQNCLEYVAVSLYSSLLTLQLYLTFHILSRFSGLPLEQKKLRRRYMLFLPLISCLSIIRFVLYLQDDLMDATDRPQRPYELVWSESDQVGRDYPASIVCTAVLSLAGDAFLAWRATVIWSHKRRFKWIPTVVYVAYFGVCIVSSISKVRSLVDIIAVPQKHYSDEERHAIFAKAQNHTLLLLQKWRIVDFAMSVGVNVVSTTMICARLLLMRREMNHIAAQSATFKPTLPYSQLLTILLESALPFTLVGVAGAITTGFMSYQHYSMAMHAYPLMLVLWINALALGPQMITFRIITGTTWITNPTTMYSQPMSQPIIFLREAVESNSASEMSSSEDQRVHFTDSSTKSQHNGV
ncbi:hypothetical protein BKA70DRAFT_1411755 [Coprinopsis sp. MPI-PUGE-AT-0042]|nr:hypothetical protein BKA70DRAFT_1411755 [Coprinopsis sp. MPI-PUGE-AT-0042]